MKAMLRIEFVAGTDIEEAIDEALVIGNRLIIDVIFNFNGISLLVLLNDNKERVLKRYNNEIKSHRQSEDI